MERHIVGFLIFLSTFALGVSVINPRLVFLNAETECSWSGDCYYDESKPE